MKRLFLKHGDTKAQRHGEKFQILRIDKRDVII